MNDFLRPNFKRDAATQSADRGVIDVRAADEIRRRVTAAANGLNSGIAAVSLLGNIPSGGTITVPSGTTLAITGNEYTLDAAFVVESGAVLEISDTRLTQPLTGAGSVVATKINFTGTSVAAGNISDWTLIECELPAVITTGTITNSRISGARTDGYTAIACGQIAESRISITGTLTSPGPIRSTVHLVGNWVAAPDLGTQSSVIAWNVASGGGGGGSGTVTTVSVVPANGLAGTVANPTTTPAITLSTTANGLLQGNGTALSAATIGTGLSFAAGTLSNTQIGLTDGNKVGITVSGGGSTWLANNNTITNNELSDMMNNRIKGRVGSIPGDPQDLTGTEVTTLLDVFTSTLKGLAPASGGGTSNFLRADGYWAAPPAGTVTDVSVVTANGLTGTVANPTTTPAITLSTTANGLLQGNGTAISAVIVGSGLSFSGGTLANTQVGLTDGDKGDITVASSGASWTVDANAITNAKLADMATATFKGRVAAGPGDPQDLTGTQATTLLDTFTTTLKGLAPASGGGTSNFLRADGYWAAPPNSGGTVTNVSVVSANGLAGTVANATTTPAITLSTSIAGLLQGNGTAISAATIGTGLSFAAGTLSNTQVGLTDGDKGDITVASSGTSWTVDANAITNAKLADMATATFKGRVAAGPGDPEDITGTQATTLLDVFTTSLKGLAPASGGGTSNFLRADGYWAAPAGSGSVTTVSVVTANGLAGTVANATTTPAITLSTTVTGLLKGNGTAISAAVSGVDYAPAGNYVTLDTVQTITARKTVSLSDASPALTITQSGAGAALDVTAGSIRIPDGTAAAPALAFRDDLNTGIFSPTNDIFGIAVNGSEAVRIQESASTPVMLIGTSTVYGAITVDSNSADGTAGAVMLAHANAGTVIQESYRGGQFAGVRSRGTKAAPTQIGAGDGMANLIGTGWTNTNGLNYGALITMKAEQAFTSTASGGRIEFHTTTSGTNGFTTLGSSTTERIRITNAGLVGIGTSTPSSLLSVGASSQFQVDSSGNLARINNIPYTFPAAQGAASTVLTNNGSGALLWTAPATGSVTTVSVVTANGLAGTVANPTTAPAITLSTTVTGLLKGNGTTISAAVADVDYLAPGPAYVTSSTALSSDNALARYDGLSGKIIQESSGMILSDGGEFSRAGNISMATSGAGTNITLTAIDTVQLTGDLLKVNTTNVAMDAAGAMILTAGTSIRVDASTVLTLDATTNIAVQNTGTTKFIFDDTALQGVEIGLPGARRAPYVRSAETALNQLQSPLYSFVGDQDTGLTSSTDDTISLVTGATSRVTIDTTAITAALPHRGTDGVVSAPAYSFTAATGTGMWRGGKSLNFAVDGDNILALSQNAAGNQVQSAANGTVGRPAYTWSSQTNSGFYYDPADSYIGVTLNGTFSCLIDASGMTGLVNRGASIGWAPGTATALPAYGFHGDPNTGMYSPAADIIEFSTGGDVALRLDASAVTSAYTPSIITNNTGMAIGHNASARVLTLNTNSTPRVTITGNGNYVEINSALVYDPGGTVSLTADNTFVTIGARSYVRLASNSGTPTSRTFTISNGSLLGHVLVLEVASGACEIINSGNVRLSSTMAMTDGDTLSLIWNGTDWMETSRSFN